MGCISCLARIEQISATPYNLQLSYSSISQHLGLEFGGIAQSQSPVSWIFPQLPIESQLCHSEMFSLSWTMLCQPATLTESMLSGCRSSIRPRRGLSLHSTHALVFWSAWGWTELFPLKNPTFQAILQRINTIIASAAAAMYHHPRPSCTALAFCPWNWVNLICAPRPSIPPGHRFVPFCYDLRSCCLDLLGNARTWLGSLATLWGTRSLPGSASFCGLMFQDFQVAGGLYLCQVAGFQGHMPLGHPVHPCLGLHLRWKAWKGCIEAYWHHIEVMKRKKYSTKA